MNPTTPQPVTPAQQSVQPQMVYPTSAKKTPWALIIGLVSFVVVVVAALLVVFLVIKPFGHDFDGSWTYSENTSSESMNMNITSSKIAIDVNITNPDSAGDFIRCTLNMDYNVTSAKDNSYDLAVSNLNVTNFTSHGLTSSQEDTFKTTLTDSFGSSDKKVTLVLSSDKKTLTWKTSTNATGNVFNKK